jgi:hypothetical protein
MHTYYGLWIDHSKAVLVKANKMGETSIEHFSSDVEGHNHGGESEEHLSVTNQHRHEERRHNQMKAFCREIIAKLKDANELLVFGPGTAKHEFKNILEEHKVLFEKLKELETTDKLSDPQIVEHVKKAFGLPI